MVKIQGTLCMRSHISVHHATTKYFSNSFVFKNKIEKEGLPRDITPDLGAGGPRFESGRPDHSISQILRVILAIDQNLLGNGLSPNYFSAVQIVPEPPQQEMINS